MKLYRLVLILLSLSLLFSTANAQVNSGIPGCEAIFPESKLDQKAGFKDGMEELVYKIITPELKRLYRTYAIPVTTLKMSILISAEGKAIAFRYDTYIPKIYQNQLSQVLKETEDWIPGRLGDRSVCGELRIWIRCIKYD